MRGTLSSSALAVVVLIACNQQPSPVPTNQSASHDGHAPAPATPAPRTTLLGNLGSYHREITTTNADAQKFFDEGLTLLYGFNHEESFKSFEIAAANAASDCPDGGIRRQGTNGRSAGAAVSASVE